MLPDYPIKSRTEDLLRRAPLAEKVASLIFEFQGDESFVIGIDGAWGSGKTSFINLVL
jgi:predicted KAP-like P-loop ATPase